MSKPTIKLLEINWLEDFAKSLISESKPQIIEEQLSWFLNYYKVLNYEMGYDRAIWRARIANDEHGFSNVNELMSPPKHLAKVGRMNEEKQPIFYASFNKFTAFEEIGAKEGDFIHMAGFKLIDKIRFCIVGEILKVHRSGQANYSPELAQSINGILNKMPLDAALSYVYMDGFSSSILRNPDASKSDYVHSRILSKLLLSSTESIEAILYSSVTLEDSINLAIKEPAVKNKLEMVGNSVVRIKKKYEYGLYDFELIRNAAGNHDDGTIVWQ